MKGVILYIAIILSLNLIGCSENIVDAPANQEHHFDKNREREVHMPITTITFRLDNKGIVTLLIYSGDGSLLTTLVNHEHYSEGTYEVTWDASSIPSGNYYFQIITVSDETGRRYEQTKKLLLVK